MAQPLHLIDLAACRGDGADHYLHNAPLLMLFHGNRRIVSYEENAQLVCHHAMLAAVSLGLGATIIGLIPPVVDRSKVLRKRYGVPKENKILAALIIGRPKYKYKKSIHRELAGVKIV
ncbi:nitroreductase family protein [Candidatus Sumerlaeota bacterium]|nr:nitroreductase family protein [Candidatus Sumerlaeota bacterium]